MDVGCTLTSPGLQTVTVGVQSIKVRRITAKAKQADKRLKSGLQCFHQQGTYQDCNRMRLGTILTGTRLRLYTLASRAECEEREREREQVPALTPHPVQRLQAVDL